MNINQMSTNTSQCCISTSTSDLYHRQTTYSSSSTQTISSDNEDEYGYYEEILSIPTTPISKSNQSTLCRTNRYSVGCLTKPAYLIP